MAREKQDHYAVLGVPREANQKEIKDKFRQWSKELHPDADAELSPERKVLYKSITEAYYTLSHPSRRRIYDDQYPDAGKVTLDDSPPSTTPPQWPPARRTSAQSNWQPDSSLFEEDEEAVPVDWELTPPERPLRLWVSALSPVAGFLPLTIFVFESSAIFNSQFIQHPPSGFLGVLAVVIGLVTGIISIVRVLLGIFMLIIVIGFTWKAMKELERD